MPKRPEQHRVTTKNHKKKLASSKKVVLKPTIVVYQPIETIENKEDFPQDRKDGCDNYWELFFPRQKQIDKWGENLRAYLQRRHKNCRVLRVKHGDDDTAAILKGLTANDTVYVHSHGNSEKIGLRPYGLNESQLAERMEEDELPKVNTPQIKMWSCNSGAKTPGKTPETTISKEVGKQLKGLGYLVFTIFGYNGSIRPISAKQRTRKKVESNAKNKDVPAKETRVQYDFK